MDNVASFIERSKEFEQAHYSCRELLEERINNIEKYVTRWLLIAIGGLLLLTAAGFTYFHFRFMDLQKKVDYRYFLIEESLEDIHGVKLELGRVVRNY